MPFEFWFETPARPIARVRGWNGVDYDSWYAIMEALRNDPEFQPESAILLDVRDATNAPPPGTAPLLAHAWRTLAAGHCVAILTPRGTTADGIARLVSILTAGGVQVYTHLEDALRWLPLQEPLQ